MALFPRLDVEAYGRSLKPKGTGVIKQPEIFHSHDIAEACALQERAKEIEIQSCIVHIIGRRPSSEHHSHHMKAAIYGVRWMQEQLAEDVQIWNRGAQATARLEDAMDALERILQFAVVTKMLQNVGCVDLRTTFVSEERQVVAVANVVHDRARQGIQDGPAFALHLTANVQFDPIAWNWRLGSGWIWRTGVHAQTFDDGLLACPMKPRHYQIMATFHGAVEAVRTALSQWIPAEVHPIRPDTASGK
jgi:hypothetical protein